MRQARTRARAGAIACAALITLALAPASDADAPGSIVAFRTKASNGYSIFGLAFSRRADGRGNVTLFVGKKGATAIYFAPASVTASGDPTPNVFHPPSAIHADLGGLGRIDLEFTPSGAVKRERSVCETDTVGVEAGTYRGAFEFQGEEGYAEANANSVSASIGPLLSFICPGKGVSETSGAGLRGARLRISGHWGDRRLSAQFNQNRPGARMPFEATLRERVRAIRIQRSIEGIASPASLTLGTDLRSALLKPSTPFEGSASFHRSASAAGRWTGNLTVDFPGRSDVHLTGAGIESTLTPARRIVESPQKR